MVQKKNAKRLPVQYDGQVVTPFVWFLWLSEANQINEAPRSKLRGILRNSPSLLRRSSFGYEGRKPLPSFAIAMEGSPRLHPRSKLRGIRRRRTN